MNGLIVGNEDCSFNEIVNTLSKNDRYVSLMEENWREFAMALETPGSEIAEIEQDLLLKKTSIMASVHRLLMIWRETKANKAKFTTLLDILETGCGWKDMAECLWKQFQKKMPENVTWADLDERSQEKVMESQMLFQGHLKSMRELCSLFDDDREVETILNAALSGTTILQLLDSKPVSLTCNSFPDIPSYYIPRSVSSGRRINPELFRRECLDIFLIQDIDLSDLSAVARNNPISKSSRHMEKDKIRFILLEFPEDFEKIAQRCGSTSVHWLKCKNGNFYWVKTRGSLNLILEHIHHEQDVLSEEEFVQELHEEHKRKLPVIIADVPGMGKTCLLAKLFQKRKSNCDEKTMRLFISLPEFLKDVGDLPKEVCKENICKWIAEHVSRNAFGQEIVSKMLLSDDHQVEVQIYFDGFDEVSSHQLSFTKCILEYLSKQLTHVHITITTRVHKRRELEETLNVLSYSLAPFLKDDQTEFFEKYWASCDISINENLKKLACYLVDRVTSVLPSKDCDVVGIPLQCCMLADIYEEHAAKYSKASSSKALETSVNIQSVHEMYRALMTKRFSACVGEEKNVLKRIHVHASISTVFSDGPPEFLESSRFSVQDTTDLELEKVNSLGIMKAEWANNTLKFRFLHQSYAEFLLAEFLAETLFSEMEDSLQHKTMKMLLTEAFAFCDEDPDVNTIGMFGYALTLWIELCKVPEGGEIREKWEEIADALNVCVKTPMFTELSSFKRLLKERKVPDLDAHHSDPFYFVLYFWREKDDPKLSQLLNALRSLGFTEAAKTLGQFRVAKTFQRSSLCFFFNSFLFHKQLSEASSSSNLFSRFHRLLSKVDLEAQPLFFFHVLQSCLYHDFECLFVAISKYYRQGHTDGKMVEKQNCVSKRIPWILLIPVAAKHSSSNLFKECCEFVELMGECRGAGFEKGDTVQLKSLECAVHRGDFIIFYYLFNKIDLSIAKMMSLLALCCTESLNQSEHVINEKCDIVRIIAKVSKQKNPNFRMPPLLYTRVHPTILQVLVKEGADLNFVDEENKHTVAHSVASDYSPEQFHWFVELLIQHKSIQILSVCDHFKQTPLHIALRNKNVKVETIELVSVCLGDCFNHPNDVGESELFSAVTGLQNMRVLEAIVKCGGDPHRLQDDKRTVLHYAAKSGNVEAIRYFVSLGCSVNARDKDWRTPLHYALIWGEQHLDDVVCVLLEHNANAKIRDRFGDRAISYAKEKDKLWMLKPDTLDRLAKMSKETNWDIAVRNIYALTFICKILLLMKNRMWMPLTFTILRGLLPSRRVMNKNGIKTLKS